MIKSCQTPAKQKSQLKGRLILQTVHENGQEKQVLPPPEDTFSRQFCSLHFHKKFHIFYVFGEKIHLFMNKRMLFKLERPPWCFESLLAVEIKETR